MRNAIRLCLTAALVQPAVARAQTTGWETGAPAQPAPVAAQAAVPAGDAPPHTGFLMQARMQTQVGILSSLTGSPGFVAGYHSDVFTLGLGVGFSRFSTDVEGTDTVSGTLYQLAPMVFYDVWTSADARTRLNLVGSIGYGSASLTITSEFCDIDYYGDETCDTDEAETSATLIPLAVGLGGDHYLARHFALGAEIGAQALFVSGVEVEGDEIDTTVDTQVLYGLLRFTILVGE